MFKLTTEQLQVTSYRLPVTVTSHRIPVTQLQEKVKDAGFLVAQ